MTKKYIVAALLGASLTSSVALAESEYPVTVFAELKTLNNSLFDGKSTEFGEVVGMQQSLNKNFYYSLSATVPKHSAYTLEADLGLQTSYHGFSPFVELEGTTSNDGNNHFTEQLDYDFGAAYQLTKVICPMVAFDSLGLNNNDTLKYGASFQLSKKLSLGVYGLKDLKHPGSSTEIKVGFTV